MQFQSGIFHSQALKRMRGLGSGSCIIQFAGDFHSKALERRRDGNTSFTAAIFLVWGRLVGCCIICVQVLYRRPSPVVSVSFGCFDIRSFHRSSIVPTVSHSKVLYSHVRPEQRLRPRETSHLLGNWARVISACYRRSWARSINATQVSTDNYTIQ